MKILIHLLLCCFSTATLAQPIDEKGNGGDGIVLETGQVVLYDLFERGIDADQTWNYSYYKSTIPIFKPLWFSLVGLEYLDMTEEHGMDNYEDPTKNSFIPMVTMLSRLHRLEMDWLAQVIVRELMTLTWQSTPLEMLPNEDTQPPVDLKKYKRVGCALNRGGQLTYSTYCTDNMSGPNKAALGIHEAVYSIFRRLHPKSDNSYHVRAVTAAIVAGDDNLPKIMANSGLKSIVDQQERLKELFFEGGNGLSRHCTFKNDYLKRVDIWSLEILDMAGEIETQEGDKKEIEEITDDFDKMENGQWHVHEIPTFDLIKRTVSIWVGRPAGDGESFNLILHLDGSNKARIADLVAADEDTATGKCGPLP